MNFQMLIQRISLGHDSVSYQRGFRIREKELKLNHGNLGADAMRRICLHSTVKINQKYFDTILEQIETTQHAVTQLEA